MTNNPFSDLLTGYRSDCFYGRQQEVTTILQASTGEAPQSHRFHGLTTIGKTTLLRYLADPSGAMKCQHKSLGRYGPGRDGPLVGLYLDLFNTTGDDVLLMLCQKVLGHPELASRIDPVVVAAGVGCQDVTVVRDTLNKAMRAIADANTRLLLCLDHFDRAFESMEIADEWYLRGITQHHGLVIASERSLPELRLNQHISSPLVNSVRPRTLGLLLDQEAVDLVDGTLNRWDKKDDPKVFGAATAFIARVGGRQPYLLALVGQWLLDRINENPELGAKLADQEGDAITARLLPQLEADPAFNELFHMFVTRLDADERQALSALGADRPLNPERGQKAVAGLRQKSLVSSDLLSDRPALFSELFAAYVRRNLPPGRGQTVEQVFAGLTRQDRQVAEYLKARANEMCSFETLLKECWGSPDASRRALEAAILRIRKALREQIGDGWEYIRIVRQRGYQYVPRPDKE